MTQNLIGNLTPSEHFIERQHLGRLGQFRRLSHPDSAPLEDGSLHINRIIQEDASSSLIVQPEKEQNSDLLLTFLYKGTNVELPLVVESVALEAAVAGGWKATVHLLDKMQGALDDAFSHCFCSGDVGAFALTRNVAVTGV